MQGGALPNPQYPVYGWLRSVFEEGLPLVYEGRDKSSPSPADEILRASKFSEENLEKAWRIVTRCSEIITVDGLPTESTLKSLVDNFLIEAYGVWHFAAIERNAYMNTFRELVTLNEKSVKEFIDKPLCSAVNELETVETQRQSINTLKAALEDRSSDDTKRKLANEYAASVSEMQANFTRRLEEMKEQHDEELFSIRALANDRDMTLKRSMEDQLTVSKSVIAELKVKTVDDARTIAMLQSNLEKLEVSHSRRVESQTATYEAEIKRLQNSERATEKLYNDLKDKVYRLQSEKEAIQKHIDRVQAQLEATKRNAVAAVASVTGARQETVEKLAKIESGIRTALARPIPNQTLASDLAEIDNWVAPPMERDLEMAEEYEPERRRGCNIM